MKQANLLMANEIVTAAVTLKMPIPDRIKALMVLHHQTPYFGKPISLFEQVTFGIISQSCLANGISFEGVRQLENCPVKNMKSYEHSFVTKDGKKFTSSEMGSFSASNPLDSLSRSVLEMFVETGCIYCNFGAKIDAEDDIVCPICQDGEIRRKLRSDGTKAFIDSSWAIFSEAIGPEYSMILVDLASWFFKMNHDKAFQEEIQSLLDKAHKEDDDEVGKFLHEKTDRLLGVPPPVGKSIPDLVKRIKEMREDDEKYGEFDPENGEDD